MTRRSQFAIIVVVVIIWSLQIMAALVRVATSAAYFFTHVFDAHVLIDEQKRSVSLTHVASLVVSCREMIMASADGLLVTNLSSGHLRYCCSAGPWPISC